MEPSSDSEEEPGYSSTKPRPISQLPDYATVDKTQKTPKPTRPPPKVTHTKPALPPPKPPARKFITEPKPPPQIPPRAAVMSPVVMATEDHVTSPLATTSAATGFESVQDYVSIEEIERKAANEQGDTSSPDMYVSHDEMPQTALVAKATEDFHRAKATVAATPSFIGRKCAMKTKKGSSLDQVYGTQSVQWAVYTPETTSKSNVEENNETKPSILSPAPPMPFRPAPSPPSLAARAPPPTPCTPPNQCENYSDQQIDAPSTSTTTQTQNIPRLNTGFLSELAQKLQRSANVTMDTSVDTGVAMETVTIETDTNSQESGQLPSESVDRIENFQQEEPVYDEPYYSISDDDDADPIYRPWGISEKTDLPEKTDQPDQQNADPPDYDTWEPDPEYLELEEEEYQEGQYENASVSGENDSMYAEVPSPYEEECDDGIYVDPNDLDSDHSTEYEASWGSSEFDSYSDDEEEEKNVKEQGQKVLSKFKNWQARRKSSVKEEELTFIEVQINDEKHPPPCLPPEPDNLSDNQRLRRHIVECILESENNYVSSLQRIVWEYEYALSDCTPPLISQNKCLIIFYKVRHLLQMHYQFRIALSDVVRTWDQDEMIGQSFTASFSKGMVVDIYSDFVNNFSLATELVKRCARTKPSFAQFLKERQASPDKLSLFGLMVKPIQRFPQFILLMQDLLKQTCTDHPDRFNLQVALTELDNLAHKLNDRKRFSSQILGASQLFKNMDVRHVRRHSEAAPLLIRQDDITETHCTGQNQTPRWKPLRLHLLNDTLLCTHPLIKSGKSGTEERHRLKWSVPLSSVTIKDSVITPDTSVVLKGQPGQIVITSTRPSRGMESSLYSELDGLIHDFTVITQVSSLVSSLKRSYQELSEDSLQSLTRSIQLRIQTLDEHLRTMDSTSLQLLIKSKQGKRHVIVDFGSAEVKRKWLQDLKMQEIACLPSNKPSWLDSHLTSKQSPLYMTQLNLNITNEMNQMLCGAPFSLSAAWGPSASRHYLWLCGYRHLAAETDAPVPGAASAPPTAKGGTSVVIVALDAHNMPNVVESFRLCKEMVRCCLVVSGVSPASTGTASRRTKHVDTVWMATDNKTIRIHALSESSRQKAVCVVELSENVTSMVRVGQWVVAATDSGIVRLLDAAHTGDSWRLLCSEKSCSVSDRSVDCLCWDGEQIWCGAGRRVVTMEPAGFQVKRELSVNHSADVRYLARSGVGLFVGFAARAQLQLYHAETLQHLQDINLASTLRDRIEPTGSEEAHITALSVIEHWLWIGTSIGCVLLLPLPRVQGVPLISSRPLVSRHSHSSPVRFILQANQQPSQKTVMDPHPENEDRTSPDPNPRSDFLTESTSNLQKSRSMNDLDTIEPSETDRIKLLYSNLFGPKSEDLDQVLNNQLTASDSHAKTGVLTMPSISFRSEASESEFSKSNDVSKKVSDDFMLVLAGGEGYVDREKKIWQECGPNIQIWCSKG